MSINGQPLGKQASHPYTKKNVAFILLGLFLLTISIRSTLPLGNVLISFLAALCFWAAITLNKAQKHYGRIVFCVLWGGWCVIGYPVIPYEEWLTDYEKSVRAVQNLYVPFFLMAFIGIFTAKKKKEISNVAPVTKKVEEKQAMSVAMPHIKNINEVSEKKIPNYWMAQYAHLRTGEHAKYVHEMQEKTWAIAILVIIFGWVTKILIESIFSAPKEMSLKQGLVTIPAEYTPYVLGVFATIFGLVTLVGLIGVILSLLSDSKREVTIKLDRIIFYIPLTKKMKEVKFSTVTDMKSISQGSNKIVELTYYDEEKKKFRKCGVARTMSTNKAEFDEVLVPLLFQLVGKDLEKVKERIKVNQSRPKNQLDFMDKIILALALLFIVLGIEGVITGNTLMLNFKDIMASKISGGDGAIFFGGLYILLGVACLIVPWFSYKNWNFHVAWITTMIFLLLGLQLWAMIVG